MSARNLATGGLVLAALALVVVVLLSGGGDGYRFKMVLDNGSGLRDGSVVTVGGVDVGTVDLSLGDDDQVIVEATLNPGEGPIGRDARAFISSQNLLGQKRVELIPGDTRQALPSGGEIPSERVKGSTNLDEVLQVMTPDTRARLKILINEAGNLVDGRRGDISQLLAELPPTIAGATEVLRKVSQDNEALGRVIENTDRLVAEVTAKRRDLTRLVDTVGQTGQTVVTKRTALRETLARAPQTLATLQRFLGELERTTVPLGPAARDITATAPEVNATLAELPATTRAAEPALGAAVAAAPRLTRLATGATPVVEDATPVLGELARFSKELVPVTDTLNMSVDNLLATVQNWSRAIQFRDSLGHVFRGSASITPNTVTSLVNRFGGLGDEAPASDPPARERRADRPSGADSPTPSGAGEGSDDEPPVRLPAQNLLDTMRERLDRAGGELGLGPVGDELDNQLRENLHPLSRCPEPARPDASQGLLDYLLAP